MKSNNAKRDVDEAVKIAGHLHQWLSANRNGDQEIARLSLRELNRYFAQRGYCLTEKTGVH